MRAIDADALKAILDQEAEHERKSWDMYDNEESFGGMNAFCRAIAIVEEAPTIEPERKPGKWERHYSRPNVYADLYWHCSECGYKNDDQYANIYHKFCPNCGADMRGEQDERQNHDDV